jgi:hypothetical protein
LLSGTPPGRYSIEAVAFDRDTLAPLTAYDADGQALGPELSLGQITVTVPEAPTDPGSLSIQDRLDVALGPVTLLGANFDRDEAGPGDLVRLTTFWRTDEQSEHLELTVHLTLLNPDGSTVAEYNFPPTARWHPTTAWQPGDIWRGQHILYLPADLASGEYSWRLSMDSIYQSTDLPSTIDISAPDRTFSPPPVDVEIKTSLDDVFTLVGANLKPETSNLRSGDPLTVTLVWRAEDTATASYHVFLHLLGPDGALVAQSDGIPAHWTRPTTGWMPGEYITDERVLLVPDEASAGDYALAVGLYVPGEARLTTAEGSDTITLTTVSVTAP